MNTAEDTDVIVVGCGIIGACIAWLASRQGLSVRCLDPEPGSGATHAAAGMLAAVAESGFGEHDLMRLNVESAARWPEFAAELEEFTGQPTGLRRSGALAVAFDADDRQQLHRLLQLQHEWGLDAREINVTEARELEPSLGPRIAGAVWLPDDHQVNPRAVQTALLTALELTGADVIRRPAAGLTWHDSSVTGVVDDTGARHRARVVVLAAGWNSRDVTDSLPGPPVVVPTRPVKGQVIRLDARQEPAFQLSRVIRGIVQHRNVYLVPRADGEIVIGATSEEQPDDRLPTAGGIFALLRDARALVPGIDELPVTELTARARPGSPDNMPLIGPAGVPGLVLATGHHRNGILLAPLTAAAVAAYCTDGKLPDSVAAATPARFTDGQEG